MSQKHPNLSPEDEDDDQDRPWNEEQWEAFMKRQDGRGARFGELLETLMDDPSRERKIGREMGWDREDEAGESDDGEDFGAMMEEAAREVEEAKAGGENLDELFDDDENDLQTIEAYRRSNAIAMKIHDALKPWLERPGDEEIDEEFGEAFINAHSAGGKIAGGHGIGYDDHAICGNIVKNKIALAANQRCEEALVSLRDRALVPAELVMPLLVELLDARRFIERRIADLRARV